MGKLLKGLLAGAAGTTALNTATYLDMLWRARPASSTPEESVRRSLERRNPRLLSSEGPDSEPAGNRRSALGSLMGVATGAGTGVVLALMRPWLGSRRSPAAAVVATLLANAGSVLPMWALGVTDPRSWSAADWASDVLPHLAYGVVTAATLDGLAQR